ncbi:MAG: helix-turn-helix transcriptional regulator [archaeon]|nr:helix-turn-helix transcriptional regulator [archaeon]
MACNQKKPRIDCAVDATMSIIEGRWKTVILCKLHINGPMRFSKLIKEINGVSPRILTKQLKEMEADGIVLRTPYSTIPPKVEYSITDKGRSLGPILSAMAEWGLKNVFNNKVQFDESINLTQ